MAETQLRKLRDTSDALIGRSSPIFRLWYGCLWIKSPIWLLVLEGKKWHFFSRFVLLGFSIPPPSLGLKKKVGYPVVFSYIDFCFRVPLAKLVFFSFVAHSCWKPGHKLTKRNPAVFEWYHIWVFAKKKKWNSFFFKTPHGHSCGNFGKKQLQKLQKKEDSLLLQPLRYHIPREKIRTSFSLFFQPAQHNTQTQYRQHQRGPSAPTTYRRHAIPRISQSTSKTYTHSYTHDDGPPSRARRLETGACVWRGRGALGCLGCSLPLLTCMHVMSWK